jgi:hypothetical protein
MRHWAMVLLVMASPVAGFAQDAVIRIEAKRGMEAAASAAEGWNARFDDVVTFPLSGGWIGIALGPMSRAEAEARLTELRQAGRIPADSFVSVPEPRQQLTPVEAATGGAPASVAADAGVEASGTELPVASPEPAEPAAADPVPVAAPGSYIRLESLEERTAADAALSRWRETLPEAGLWGLPNGWLTIALGPVDDAAAAPWLAAFKKAQLVAKDAFVSPSTDLGPIVSAGKTPNLPAPPVTAAPMPPLEEVQRALRWAGHYDGGIDGKTGPRTEAAIIAEIIGARQSTDPGTAMRKLIDRRDAWRRQIGLVTMEDQATGLSLTAPMDKLSFDRTERALSIYGPKGGSGAALILFSRPGGQQDLLDMAGLATALGWVPQPTRMITRGHVLLEGADEAHRGRAEGWVRDGQVEGFVLVWPAADVENQRRIAAEMSDSLKRMPPPAEPVASEAAVGDALPASTTPTAPAPLVQP